MVTPLPRPCSDELRSLGGPWGLSVWNICFLGVAGMPIHRAKIQHGLLSAARGGAEDIHYWRLRYRKERGGQGGQWRR